MTMGFVTLRQDSHGAGTWSCTVMSQVRASAFSLYPELTSGYHLSSTSYTVVVFLSLKKMSFSRLQCYLIGKTKFKTKIISIIFLPKDATVNVSVHFFSYFLYAITFYIQVCNLSDPQYLGWWYHVKMIIKGLRGVSQTEGDTHRMKEYDSHHCPSSWGCVLTFDSSFMKFISFLILQPLALLFLPGFLSVLMSTGVREKESGERN